MNEEHFFTPSGLRVGLNPEYFIDRLSEVYINDNEISNKFDEWSILIETVVLYPGTILFLATLIFMFFSGSIVNYVIVSCLAYIIGMIFKYAFIPMVDLFPMLITTVMRTTLCRNPIIKYSALIAVGIITSKYKILIAFICVSLLMGLLNYLAVTIIHKINFKKHGKHFFDVEIIALKRFNGYINFRYRNVKELKDDYLADTEVYDMIGYFSNK